MQYTGLSEDELEFTFIDQEGMISIPKDKFYLMFKKVIYQVEDRFQLNIDISNCSFPIRQKLSLVVIDAMKEAHEAMSVDARIKMFDTLIEGIRSTGNSEFAV